MSDRSRANQSEQVPRGLSAFVKKHYPQRERWRPAEGNDPPGFSPRRPVYADEEVEIKAIGALKVAGFVCTGLQRVEPIWGENAG